MNARGALWLVRDTTPAQIPDADRVMMAKWLRAAAENQDKTNGETGRVMLSASSARALAEMLDKSPAPAVSKNG